MNCWQYRPIPFKFQLSYLTLFSRSIRLQTRTERLIDETTPVAVPTPPTEELIEGSQGFLIRGLPVTSNLPSISRAGEYLCYVPFQYQHCYIDFGLSFGDYQKKFSTKSRATIHRKIRKYAEHCGGAVRWKTYKTPAEMDEFFHLARTVSKSTYQERLLDAGLPDGEDFKQQAVSLAAQQRIRAYILFDGERPVSYLYCPVENEVLIYTYLGYDPDYAHLSVGTVLHWLVIEQLFGEEHFRYFDFTEGQSDHKRFFATHQRQCANVFLVKSTARNLALIYGHLFTDRCSYWLGKLLDRLGLKSKIKHFLRFAR